MSQNFSNHVTRPLVLLLLLSSFAAAQSPDGPADRPLSVLVISPVYSASSPYADFDYLSRQLSARMVFWHSYPREWDVYHLMDSIWPRDYKAALAPNNKRANQRLRTLLDQEWDLIFWTRFDLPEWARQKLATRVSAGLPVIFCGDPKRLETKDTLRELMAECEAIAPADLGATRHVYEFRHIEKLRALGPAKKLLIFPHALPFPESSIPAHDEIAILCDFWREVISQLCDRQLSPVTQEIASRNSEKTAFPVTLSLTQDQPGADFGQVVNLTVNTENIPEAHREANRVVLAIADHTGRLLWQQQRTVSAEQVDESFAYTIPDLGVNIYAFYVTAWLLKSDQVIGRATSTVYHYKPWDMRRQWQWSPWDWLYREPSYHAAAAMKLFEDAGLNSLGFCYPTQRSLWWAERYGWRKYGEVTGGHRLWNSPVVETADDNQLRARVRAQMVSKHAQFGSSWGSAALILASLGEEPGFSKGWGRTYYWEKDVAPPVAQKSFQQFLKERYPDVAALSKSWQTPIEDWSDARLVRKYALPGPRFEPSRTVDDAPDEALDFARYEDTSDFFHWYFQKVAGYATEKLHEINPGVSAFYSLHGPDGVGDIGVAHSHHVYYPKEYQAIEAARERMRRNGMPSFSLIWNHFDDPAIVSAGLWSQITNQVTHVNFWLGFPLMFNNDMTHTRASMVLKRQLTQFQPVSGLLAKAHVVDSGVAMLDGPFIGKRASSKIRSFQAPYAALAEAGFPPAFVDQNSLSNARMIFASGATHVGKELADNLKQYVEQGGVLITTAGFATRSEHGQLQYRIPGHGFDQWMGFEFGQRLTSDAFGIGPRPEGGPFQTRSDTASLDGIDMPQSPHAVELLDIADDVKVLGRFKDGTPALLYRQIGKGQLYHMNFLHREWGWPVLAKPEREALRRIITGIADRAGIAPRFFIECRSPGFTENHAMPFWGSQLFVGQDGKTHYLVVYNDHRSSLITGRVHWFARDWQVTDLLNGEPLSWTGRSDRGDYVDLSLLPGDGKILRLVPSGHTPEQKVFVTAQVDAGQLPSGLKPVVPRGWPSEQWPQLTVTESEFLAALQRLRSVYEGGRSRSDLSYYLFDVNVENRHGITRMLAEQDWPRYVSAIDRSLRSGERILLTGEDLGFDPATGLSVTTHRPGVLAAIAKLGSAGDAQWYSASVDGQMLVLKIGDGRLVLDRTSLDSIGFRNADYDAWHEIWWPRITHALHSENKIQPIVSPDVSTLRRWLAGRWLPTPKVTVDRYADGRTAVSFSRYLLPVENHKVKAVAVPQGYRVDSAEIALRARSYMGFGNGDFERANGSHPAGIRIYGAGQLDGQVRHSGQYSLRLEPTLTRRPLKALAGISLGRRDQNLAGKTYRLRVWVKAEKLHRLDFKIRAMKWGKPVTWKNDLWIPVGRVPKGTFDWREFDFQVKFPSTRANYVNFEIHAYGEEGSKVWIDNMRGGELPSEVKLSVSGRSNSQITLPISPGNEQMVITNRLADLINAYLPHAPIDRNGMAVVPLQVTMNGVGSVTLSDPKFILVAADNK